LLLNILSTPSLLDAIRLELPSSISEPSSLPNIDIPSLRTKCSLLTSTYHETLRHIASNSSGRSVLSDTYLSSTHTDHPPILLKKSSVLQIPGGVLHTNPTLWGPDVEAFNPRRFMTKDGDSVHAIRAAYRPFGGGATLCPGRHFAFVEVTAVVAAIVGGFEVKPEIEGEPWRLPRKDEKRMPLSVLKPVGDVRIRIRRRVS
jgi:cytochrome P450